MSELYKLFEDKKEEIMKKNQEEQISKYAGYVYEIIKILTYELKNISSFDSHSSRLTTDVLFGKKSVGIKVSSKFSNDKDTFTVIIEPEEAGNFAADLNWIKLALKASGYDAVSVSIKSADEYYSRATMTICYNYKLEKEKIKEEAAGMEERATEIIRQGEETLNHDDETESDEFVGSLISI